MATTKRLSERAFQASVDARNLARDLDEIAKLAHGNGVSGYIFTLTEGAKQLRNVECALDHLHFQLQQVTK